METFTVLLYNKSSGLENVDEARMEMFCHVDRTMEKIPPTRAVFLQHVQHYIKLVSGLLVNGQYRTGLVQMVGAGIGTPCPGLLIGQLYLLLAKFALNLYTVGTRVSMVVRPDVAVKWLFGRVWTLWS